MTLLLIVPIYQLPQSGDPPLHPGCEECANPCKQGRAAKGKASPATHRAMRSIESSRVPHGGALVMRVPFWFWAPMVLMIAAGWRIADRRTAIVYTCGDAIAHSATLMSQLAPREEQLRAKAAEKQACATLMQRLPNANAAR